MEELELPQAAAALARAPGQCAVECAPAQSAALLRAMRAAGLQPGVVFREDALYERLRAGEYLALFAGLSGHAERAAGAARAMELEDLLGQKISRLDEGQRRRVSLAREIAKAPDAFFLEEPLSGLKEREIGVVLQWLERVGEQGTPLICTTELSRSFYLLPGAHYRLDGQDLQLVENAADQSAPPEAQVEKIPARDGEKLLLFNPADIDYAESADGRSLVSVRGSCFACPLTLEELSARLERYGFFRCHRSYLVNMQKVEEIIRWTRNSYALRVKGGPEGGVPLSKGRVEEMKSLYRF
ncbi:LytTR family transcriptional regulator DNA-binding domain-containing protein [Anaerofilum sp. BX8]|uniref:LytTR family transcriptional regulator DNA-binding domain-containing protein n=1 Tax=Anaerofilum hominis TaxID=2763016 RepID=A0A923I643_9FIRM|nr:LytTR family transcriptional regulator DNA-binding domain-containing protein [Anaerofilum hominis]